MTAGDGRLSMKEAAQNIVDHLADDMPKPGYMWAEAKVSQSENMTQADNPVTSPAHYTGGEIECKDAMRAMMGHEGMMHFWQGCVFKYLWRWRDKGGIRDLEKARQCLDFLIEEAGRG